VVSKTKSKAMLTQQCVQNAAKHSLFVYRPKPATIVGPDV